jgi:hypothetical protein
MAMLKGYRPEQHLTRARFVRPDRPASTTAVAQHREIGRACSGMQSATGGRGSHRRGRRRSGPQVRRCTTKESLLMKTAINAALAASLMTGCAGALVAEDDPGELDDGAPTEGATRRIAIETPEGPRTVTAIRIGDDWIVDGDIVVPQPAPGGPRAAPSTHARWPGGVIPFEIDPALPSPQRVHDAIAHYQRRTAIRLVPRTGQSAFVRFVPHASACSSPVGNSLGFQQINLATGCGAGETIHEIGHLIGMWHEQSRPDRDIFVTVHPENIQEGKEHNFDKHDIDWPIAGPYDLGSIMHYGSFFFSNGNGPTITTASGGIIVANRTRLSDLDLLALDRMHPSPNTTLPAPCRTAPIRVPAGTSPKRADIAEVWQDVQNTASFATHLSTGTSFLPFRDWALRDGGFGPLIRWTAGDFDGDGDQDLLAIWNDGGLNTLTLRRSTGSSFTHEHWAIKQGGWINSTQWLPGDFNGDGRSDVAAVWNQGGLTSIAVYLSTGAGFLPHTQWAVQDGGWSDTTKWSVGNFNGDVRDDLLGVWNHGGLNTLTVRLSSGSSFAQQHWAIQQGGWANTTQFVVGDFDGNHLDDVAAVWNDGGSTSIAVFPGDGTRFIGFTQWAVRDGGWSDDTKWAAGDFTADGRSDLFAAWNHAGMSTLTVRHSTGTALAQSHWSIRSAGWQDSASWCAGTFDPQ